MRVPSRPRPTHSPCGPVRSAAAAGAVLLLAGLAAPAAQAGHRDPIGDPLPDVDPGPVRVALDLVTSAVTAPVDGVTAPGHADSLFVVDQVGQLWEVDVTAPGPVQPRLVLDVSGRLAGPVESTDERGFLGAAFSPDFAADGLLYTYTSEPVGPPADYSSMPAVHPCDPEQPVPPPDHQTVIREWSAADPTASPLSFTGSRRLLTVDQPQSNHNAGAIHFGPDRMLYIAIGDGGGADDQDCQENFDGTPMVGHGPAGNGQDPATPLGDFLRIDVLGTTSPRSSNGQYGVPADNPFVGTAGAAPEIWATGFRNPFRFSFDRVTGELWTGDVGQNDVEEVDVVTRGGNYGWRVREGAFAFDPDGLDLKGSRSDGFVFARASGPPFVDPVAQYDHDDGTAVIGGFVYRGSEMPALQGRYVFGDTSRRLKNGHGRLFETAAEGRAPTGNPVTELREGPLDEQLIGFGEDTAGELYALVFGFDGPAGDTGAVFRLRQERP